MRLSDLEFDELAAFAHKRWGLVLDQRKRTMVENRLTALRSSLPEAGGESLLSRLMGRPEHQLALFDALSTNHTGFFREGEHFDLLKEELLDHRSPGDKIRLWSAGCSSGCEPYTLAILLAEAFGLGAGNDARILATDLSVEQLGKAREGVYPPQTVTAVDAVRLRRHFDTLSERGGTSYRIKPELRRPITFALLNLLDPWKMQGPFDAIFCRNVMIYFDLETKKSLARKFLRLLRPGGLFFIGTSETLSGYDLPLDLLKVGAYRKRDDAG